jgi:NADH dehydrogenase
MNVLIVGATGVVGNATARKLLAQGVAVRAMTRTPAKAAALAQLGADVVQGDLRDGDALRRACAGMDKVLAAAHSLLGRGAAASKYVDEIGHKQLIDVAKAAGVQHFVYTSIQGTSPQSPVAFIRIKYAVEQYLQASGLPYTILRPSAFMEWHAYEFIGKPILNKGQVTLFGKGDNPRNFIAGDDVANFAVLALTDPQAIGEIITIGGPENWTNNQVAALYAQLAARPVQITHVPLVVLRVLAPLLSPFHPGLSQVMTLSVLTETSDFTFDPTATRRRYPVPLTRLADWARQSVDLATPVASAVAA